MMAASFLARLLCQRSGTSTILPPSFQNRKYQKMCGSVAVRHFSCRRVVPDTDDFVYVGKEYKICRKDEIEASISDTYKRKVLPPELLSRYVVRLSCESAADGGICDVYVVGTNHYNPEYWQKAQSVIEFLKPQVVVLELCSDRLFNLTRQIKVPTMGEMLEMWKKNEDPSWILFKWFRTKLASYWGVVGGGDFRVAYEEAMKYGGKVILGDRPHEITMRRILGKMSYWKYLFRPQSFPIQADLMKTVKDELDYINLGTQEMSKRFPDHTEINIYERDRYMSAKLLKVASGHNLVVAVVGMSHLAGIQKNWKQPVDMKHLLDTGNYTFTMGKLLSSIGALVSYHSILAIRSIRHGTKFAV